MEERRVVVRTGSVRFNRMFFVFGRARQASFQSLRPSMLTGTSQSQPGKLIRRISTGLIRSRLINRMIPLHLFPSRDSQDDRENIFLAAEREIAKMLAENLLNKFRTTPEYKELAGDMVFETA